MASAMNCQQRQAHFSVSLSHLQWNVWCWQDHTITKRRENCWWLHNTSGMILHVACLLSHKVEGGRNHIREKVTCDQPAAIFKGEPKVTISQNMLLNFSITKEENEDMITKHQKESCRLCAKDLLCVVLLVEKKPSQITECSRIMYMFLGSTNLCFIFCLVCSGEKSKKVDKSQIVQGHKSHKHGNWHMFSGGGLKRDFPKI